MGLEPATSCVTGISASPWRAFLKQPQPTSTDPKQPHNLPIGIGLRPRPKKRFASDCGYLRWVPYPTPYQPPTVDLNPLPTPLPKKTARRPFFPTHFRMLKSDPNGRRLLRPNTRTTGCRACPARNSPQSGGV